MGKCRGREKRLHAASITIFYKYTNKIHVRMDCSFSPRSNSRRDETGCSEIDTEQWLTIRDKR